MNLRSILVPVLLCVAMSASAQEQKFKAQTLVKDAVAYGKANGREALLKEVSSGKFRVTAANDLYVFIYDKTGVCIGMGYQAGLVGVNRWGLKDPDGKMIVQELIKTAQTQKSGWVDYKYINPKTGKIEPKSSYVEALDDWLVGCGFYK